MEPIPENSPITVVTLAAGSMQRHLLLYYGVGISALIAATALFHFLPSPAAAQGATLPPLHKHVQATFFSLPLFFVIGVEHVNNLPKWPSDRTKQEIPPSLERIVMRCLEKEMDRRFRDAAELCWNHHPPVTDQKLLAAHSAA